jgi:DNA-binding NarL/FixJ family response regulator
MTRVLIVDDHPVFRDGLAGLLATLPEVEVAGTAGTAEEALAILSETMPDVVLMDINLPGASGVEATRRASQIAPAAAVLVISMVDDDDSVFAALAAGARGYLLKLDLLAAGASNRQIARSLGVSLKTVQNHVSRILDKLQAADRTQAALRVRGIPPASR